MYNITQDTTATWLFYLGASLSFFLFVAINKCTGETKAFNAVNTGGACSDLEFSVTEDDTEDLDNGIVQLDPSGDWTLSIYEQANATNKDTANATLLKTFELNVKQ